MPAIRDYEGEAYRTVSGQNSKQLGGIPNAFRKTGTAGPKWMGRDEESSILRTVGNQIAYAARLYSRSGYTNIIPPSTNGIPAWQVVRSGPPTLFGVHVP